MVSQVEYLNWITGRPEQADHDLGTSNLRWGDSDPLNPAVLRDAPDPIPAWSFQEYVASAYNVAPERVLVTAGASHANLLTFAAVLDGPQHRVLVEQPGYEPLWRTPSMFGAKVDRFDRSSEANYPLDPECITAVMEPDTTLVVVTNRHNPTGRRVGRSTLAAVAEAVSDQGARLLVDEVYAPFGAEPLDDHSFGGPTAAGLPDVTVTSSLSKFQGLDGLRAGWLIADESFIDQAQIALHHVPTLSKPSLRLGSQALAMGDALSTQARNRIGANADQLRSFVEGRDDISGTVFEGSNFAFLRHGHVDGDKVTDTAWREGVLVVPGRFFNNKNRFRVSLAGEPSKMEEALASLGIVLDQF